MATTTRQVKNIPNPTGKGGFGDNPQNINAGGEPKNSLKNYVARKLANMSDEEKEEYLKGIDKDFVWKMGEGNPSNELTGKDGVPLFNETKEKSKKLIQEYLGNAKTDRN